MKDSKPDWRDGAVCREIKDFIELPESEQQLSCRGCGVRDQCLEWALSQEAPQSSPPFGWPVYGAMTANDRQKILRAQRAAATRRAIHGATA